MNINMIFDSMEPFCMVDRETYKDSYGSVKSRWKRGAEIDAFLRIETSLEADVAQAAYGISHATVVTPETIVLKVNDVIMRLSDSKTFRVTSDSDDYKIPKIASAGVRIRKVSAEEWALPEEDEKKE